MFLGNTLKPAMFELEPLSFPNVHDGLIIKAVFDKMVINNDWEEFSPSKVGLKDESVERLRFLKLVAEGSRLNRYKITNRFIGSLIASGALIEQRL